MIVKSLRAALLAAVLAAPLIAPAAALAATAGVNADLNTAVIGTYVGANDLGSVAFSYNRAVTTQFTAGTGTGKADKLFSDTRTIAASSSENLDLAGVLTDPLGATLTYGHVKAIYVQASSANTNNVEIGGAASNGFTGPFADATDKISLPPGGRILLTHGGAGWTVTAGTGDILKVANSSSGTGVDYDIMVIGTSN